MTGEDCPYCRDGPPGLTGVMGEFGMPGLPGDRGKFGFSGRAGIKGFRGRRGRPGPKGFSVSDAYSLSLHLSQYSIIGFVSLLIV